ncbi:MAG: hypothetical protein ACTSR8_21885 [Promethearchaeota archaeon]
MNIHIQNIGDCQKCALTFTSLFTSKAIKRFNITLTENPEHCDLLVIVGCLARTQLKFLTNFWKQMPQTHRVLLVGDCGSDLQDLFSFPKDQKIKNQAILFDDLKEVLPIDYHITGCPPNLNEIIDLFSTFF